jgi:mono/diheme cytochrome c family protein
MSSSGFYPEQAQSSRFFGRAGRVGRAWRRIWIGVLTLGALIAVRATWAAEAPVDPGSVSAGEYLAVAANCFSCHTARDGQPYAGGVPFFTDFGTIYSSNITPDPERGIGGWSFDDFRRAMRQGVGKHGEQLYPAFPYTAFTKISDADLRSLFAYLGSLKPVNWAPPKNDMKFPLNIRATLLGWKFMYFKAGREAPDPQRSAEENRGAYLVQALGHCDACHSPRNRLGAEESDRFMGGGTLYDYVSSGDVREWSSANLTSDPTGIEKWTESDIFQYLKTGFSERAVAFGPMDEVVVNSTRHLTDSDVHAIAAYLKTLRPVSHGDPESTDRSRMRAGEILYTSNCGSCHLPTGLGSRKTAPPLSGSAIVRAASPAALINVILHSPELSDALPRVVSRPDMPAFDAKLDNDEIALVATYVRQSWGNRASSVSANDVAGQR